jgi:hypothetical protein
VAERSESGVNGTATAVLRAMQRELAQRTKHLDDSDDIAEVTITVRLNAGTTWVRGVEYKDLRVYRARQQEGRS